MQIGAAAVVSGMQWNLKPFKHRKHVIHHFLIHMTDEAVTQWERWPEMNSGKMFTATI